MALVYYYNGDVVTVVFISGMQVTHFFYKHLVKHEVTKMRDIVTPRSRRYGDATAIFLRRVKIPSHIHTKYQYMQELVQKYSDNIHSNNNSTNALLLQSMIDILARAQKYIQIEEATRSFANRSPKRGAN